MGAAARHGRGSGIRSGLTSLPILSTFVPPGLSAFCGPSGSGKSTICAELGVRCGAVQLEQDWFLRSANGRPGSSYLHNCDTEYMEWVLKRLLEGRAVRFTPLHPRHRDYLGTFSIIPRPIVLVDGVMVLWSTLVREKTELSVFVTAPRGIREERQLDRHRLIDPLFALQSQVEIVRTIQGKRASEHKLVAPQRSLCDLELRTHPVFSVRKLKVRSACSRHVRQ